MDNKKELPERYEKPTIIKHSIGLMNKFGRVRSSVPYGKIDGVNISDLVSNYGSPLYVVSEGTLRRKYKEMYRAFSLRYPKVVIAYSYKTNYLSGVCAIMNTEGAWAEVVSGFEYDIAKNLGISGNKIIFNGPYKTKEELRRAVKEGSKVNIDSYEEMQVIEEVASEIGKQVNIGVRINMELNYPPWDRFGFNLESGHAFEAIKRVMATSSLKVNGLHIHAGTYISDVSVYTKVAEKLCSFCSKLQSELNLKLEYLDIGGGYASRNTLHSQWTSAEFTCPSFDQYAEAICPVILKGPFKPQNMPTLILEPGRSIVDEAMYLLTSVVSMKRL
jgi:diaminopimelate decarboxylase